MRVYAWAGRQRINEVATLRPGLERRLRAEITGDVRFDAFTRGRYSTDASHYQIVPVGVVVPRTIEEADRAIGIARAEGVTVLARGGGTSQCGQTVNDSLVVDCSKYLSRVLDLDVKRRRGPRTTGCMDKVVHRRGGLVRTVMSARGVTKWPKSGRMVAAAPRDFTGYSGTGYSGTGRLRSLYFGYCRQVC